MVSLAPAYKLTSFMMQPAPTFTAIIAWPFDDAHVPDVQAHVMDNESQWEQSAQYHLCGISVLLFAMMSKFARH